MDLEKYRELLLFFWATLEKTSEENLILFKDFLKDLKIEESWVCRAKIKDEELKNILRGVRYSIRLKEFLEKNEAPQSMKGYIEELFSKTKDKARDFFSRHNPENGELSIEKNYNLLRIKASRKFFHQDERIIPDDKKFLFELNCFYRKEKRRLEVSFCCRFRVKEETITGMDSENVTLFDDFVEEIGLSDFDKYVQFAAVYSEGETVYDNTCEVSWLGIVEEKDCEYGKK